MPHPPTQHPNTACSSRQMPTIAVHERGAGMVTCKQRPPDIETQLVHQGSRQRSPCTEGEQIRYQQSERQPMACHGQARGMPGAGARQKGTADGMSRASPWHAWSRGSPKRDNRWHDTGKPVACLEQGLAKKTDGLEQGLAKKGQPSVACHGQARGMRGREGLRIRLGTRPSQVRRTPPPPIYV